MLKTNCDISTCLCDIFLHVIFRMRGFMEYELSVLIVVGCKLCRTMSSQHALLRLCFFCSIIDRHWLGQALPGLARAGQACRSGLAWRGQPRRELVWPGLSRSQPGSAWLGQARLGEPCLVKGISIRVARDLVPPQ